MAEYRGAFNAAQIGQFLEGEAIYSAFTHIILATLPSRQMKMRLLPACLIGHQGFIGDRCAKSARGHRRRARAARGIG